MFKSKFMLLGTVAAMLLSGCASVPMATKSQDAGLKSFSNPAPDKSAIYIYRDSFLGSGLKKAIYLDGRLVGKSANEVYFYVEAEPGAHKLSTESEFGNNDIDINTEAGKNYFVEQYIKMGVFSGGANLKVVSEEEGKEAVLHCSLAASNIPFASKKAGSDSTRSSSSATSATQTKNLAEANMRHFYNAEKAATSLGCSSTEFVSSGPGVEFYKSACGDKSVSIRCDFGRCAAER